MHPVVVTVKFIVNLTILCELSRDGLPLPARQLMNFRAAAESIEKRETRKAFVGVSEPSIPGHWSRHISVPSGFVYLRMNGLAARLALSISSRCLMAHSGSEATRLDEQIVVIILLSIQPQRLYAGRIHAHSPDVPARLSSVGMPPRICRIIYISGAARPRVGPVYRNLSNLP